MDEIGSETLKVMNIDMPKARLYGNNLFLIEALGQLDLSQVSHDQYRKRDFSQRLAYLAGTAAACSLAIGLADRKGDNMRLILDADGMPKNILNIDLSSAFTFIGERNLQTAISEIASILALIIKDASGAGVEVETLRNMALMFIKGFEKQFIEFQKNYTKIDEAFSNINPDVYDKIDRMWFVMDNVKARKDRILNYIDPRKIDINNIKIMLLKSALNDLLRFNASAKLEIYSDILFSTAA